MRKRPTRREILAAALTVASHAALRRGSVQDPASRRIPIRFVGDGFERGHHWFIPDAEKLHVDRREKREVVIVGAGIAGCVAAWRLLEAGIEDFVVLELEDVAGGLARRGLMGATEVPFGGVTMLVPDSRTAPAVSRVLDAAGIDRGATTRFSPAVWNGIAWGPWDVRPARLPETRPSMEEGDRFSVREWLARSGGGREAPRFAERWCLMRFGARPADVSAGVFAADVGRWFGHDGHALVIPGGLSTLVAPIVAKLGSRLLPARVAVLARPERAGATVRAVNAEDAIVTDWETRAAILAVPPFIAARISPVLGQRQRLEVPPTSPWLVTAVMVSKWPSGFDPGAAFHQCADERAALIVHAGKPPEAVIVHHRPFPGSAAAPARMFLRDLDRESARDWALRELTPVFPDIREVAERLEVRRIGHGPTRPAPGFATMIAPRLRTPLPPIYPCGADYTGLPSAEAAIEDGVRGAELVLASFGRLDRSWL